MNPDSVPTRRQEPRRIVFITRNTSAKVKDERGPQLMTYPHLLVREAIVFEVLMIAMVMIALFWDAPLEQLANPLLTPNPAKAPWYFLGLQELLHFFPPFVAGILIPTLVVIGVDRHSLLQRERGRETALGRRTPLSGS